MLLDIPTHLIKIQEFRRTNWEIVAPLIISANEVITNTQVCRDELFSRIGRTIPDENVIPYATNLLLEYKNSGIDIDGDYALSISRMTPEKNCIIIPAALAKTNIKKYIAIGGDGGQLGKIRTSCEKNGIEFIHKHGISDKEKFEVIKNSKFFIYPQNTNYIGGLAPFESMFVGKPTLVSDTATHKSLYSEFITYFENDSVDSLAKAINDTIDSPPSKEVREEASTHAHETATFEKMASSLIKVFKKMVIKSGI